MGPRAVLTAESEFTDGNGNTYQTGFEQVSGNNQDPFVTKLDAAGNEVWKLTYESTPVDGRGVMVSVDDQEIPWVVFSVDGGSNEDDYIDRKETASEAFDDAYMNSYGRGGGPKVTVLAQLDPETGQIKQGTFLTARLTNGNTNTLNVLGIGFFDQNVAFEISSAAWPPGLGSSYERFPDITDEDRIDGAFKIYYEMDRNLSEIRVAERLAE